MKLRYTASASLAGLTVMGDVSDTAYVRAVTAEDDEGFKN